MTMANRPHLGRLSIFPQSLQAQGTHIPGRPRSGQAAHDTISAVGPMLLTHPRVNGVFSRIQGVPQDLPRPSSPPPVGWRRSRAIL